MADARDEAVAAREEVREKVREEAVAAREEAVRARGEVREEVAWVWAGLGRAAVVDVAAGASEARVEARAVISPVEIIGSPRAAHGRDRTSD